jgi:hypothetical protein
MLGGQDHQGSIRDSSTLTVLPEQVMEAPYSHPERTDENSLPFWSFFLFLLTLAFLSGAMKRALSNWPGHGSISSPHSMALISQSPFA